MNVYITFIVPCIQGCKVQPNSKVPTLSNLYVKSSFCFNNESNNTFSLLVIVWGVFSSFIHVIVSPLFIIISSGLNDLWVAGWKDPLGIWIVSSDV